MTTTDESDRAAFRAWVYGESLCDNSAAAAFKAGLAHARREAAPARAVVTAARDHWCAMQDEPLPGEDKDPPCAICNALSVLDKDSSGSGAATTGDATVGGDATRTPESAGDCRAAADSEWVHAIAEALGTNCGVPLSPNTAAFRRLFECVKLGAVTLALKQQAEEAAQLARTAAATSLAEAERGDRTQWQTGVEGHRRSCSRVSGPLPLACYVYLKDGTCTECGARVSLPAGAIKPPEPGVELPPEPAESSDFITRKQLVAALRKAESERYRFRDTPVALACLADALETP